MRFLSRPHQLLAFGNLSVKEKILWKYKVIDAVWKQFDLFFLCGLMPLIVYKRMIRLSFLTCDIEHIDIMLRVCGCVNGRGYQVWIMQRLKKYAQMAKFSRVFHMHMCKQPTPCSWNNHLKDIGKIWNSIEKQKQCTMWKVMMQRQTDRQTGGFWLITGMG